MPCDELRTFAASLLGVPVPTCEVDHGYELNTPLGCAPKSHKGSMAYLIPRPEKAALVIIDSDGNAVETFYRDRQMYPGSYVLRFSYTSVFMPQGKYLVKLIVNGEDKSTVSITL